METGELKRKTIAGAFWQLGQKFTTQLVGFVVSVVLARLLSPDDFGIVAMTSIFLTIAGVFADSGLGTSLVQKKDIDHLDNNTVFFFGLGLSSLLYVVLFFCAPLIAKLYDTPQLTSLVRVLGLSLFLSSISSVQSSLISRRLDFQKFFYVSLVSTIVSALVGLTMALKGCGVWALVGQGLTRSFVSVITMNRIVRWVPRLEFSFERLKALYAFGLNYMGTTLIGTFFNELRGFLIGVKYQPADLAYYNRGESIPRLINDNITGTISGVLFPAISRLQDDKRAVKTSIRRSMMTSTFLVAPLMFLLLATAGNVIELLYTEKWAMAIPFMQVVSLNYLFSIVGSANLQAMNAIGRSDITLKLEFIKKPVYLGMLLYTMTISPLAMAIGNAVYALYGATVNALPNKKLIGYSYMEQLKDILPQIAIAALSGCIVYAMGKLQINLIILLILQYLAGIGLYAVTSKILHLECYRYFIVTVKDFIKK